MLTLKNSCYKAGELRKKSQRKSGKSKIRYRRRFFYIEDTNNNSCRKDVYSLYLLDTVLQNSTYAIFIWLCLNISQSEVDKV